jgi:hypothetical protein
VHERGAQLPAAALQALTRLLSRENRVSDLVAFLVGLDAAPLLTALGLPAQEVRAKREDLLGRRETGSADLVVRNGKRVLALLEIKVSAAQHGNQFERYAGWAKSQTPSPRCYLSALDWEALSAPPDWTAVPLPCLFRSWQESCDPHAAWLASAAAAVAEDWVAQAGGNLGNAAGPVVGDLVARRIAGQLLADEDPATDLDAYADRTFGGAAMVLAYLPFPGQQAGPGAWLCADLRSAARDRPAGPWELRLGVEVKIDGEVTAAQARLTAHDMTMPIRRALTCTAVKQALHQAGEPRLAGTLTSRRSSGAALENADEGTADQWREHAAARTDGRHPILVHDSINGRKYSGYRLASLIEVSVRDLDWRQLSTLIRVALKHIEVHSSAQSGS